MHSHDIPLDYIVTPDEVIECPPIHARPAGIEWRLLPRERIEEMPILIELWHVASGGQHQPLHNS
jgi:5-formyltetrahydrofolate cyclo-ligase